MGKGGGCFPSKQKHQITAKDAAGTAPVAADEGTQEAPTVTANSENTQSVAASLKVFIVFYSMHGHVEKLAKQMKKGVDGVEGVEAVLYRVPETLSDDVLEHMKAPPKDPEVPIIAAAELAAADAVLFGFPTRFGCMAAQMKAFLDTTGQLWREQTLAGKPGGFFVSTGTQGGGQETTAWTAITQLAHHGMLFVPIGYTFGAGSQLKPSSLWLSIRASTWLVWSRGFLNRDTHLNLNCAWRYHSSREISDNSNLEPDCNDANVKSVSHNVLQKDSAAAVSFRNIEPGLTLITKHEARLWTDGRYFLQAMQQLSDQWKLMRIGEDSSIDAWISDNLQREAAIGIDPWSVSVDTAQRWERAFEKKKQKLVQTSFNLVDEVWKNRPPAETNPAVVHPLEFSGRSVAEKLKDLRVKLANEKARGIIITALDEVAWLYNIRGSDVSYSPVVHAFAIVTLNSAFLYVDKRKVSSKLDQAMGVNSSQNGVCENDTCDNDLIWVDPASCCYALFSKLDATKVLLQQSPLALAKALKNPVELEGLKNAHIRDGAAVVQYLAWLDKQAGNDAIALSIAQMQEIYGASGYFLEGEVASKKRSETMKLTEVTVSDKLEGFRASKEHFRGLSFPTISSVGPNAAIIHYSPQAEKCAELDPNSIYLFDSGGQYLDGTTDITRTVHFGKPSAHEKVCYTSTICKFYDVLIFPKPPVDLSTQAAYPSLRIFVYIAWEMMRHMNDFDVLKGHIALGNARFPNGTNGYALDILSRTPLWRYGLDYRHGTGHGIGFYLNVHEGPHQISFRPHAQNVPLQVSMTVTDEPGYYEDGSFGIRLENVLVIKEADTEFNFGDKGYLSFDHITWAPYQIKLIDLSLLTPEEIQWLNTYHSKCQEILAPYMEKMRWNG
ncbi:hypothetical protein V6N11_041030 [Hibiscus sabdariffa]|uniref:NAD(P)H dehydrogenase (quinone) n=1 Tax=Hibiscus sabdariffa TaxID=183260 RepID=A0ABR2RJB5_9ROSI